MSSGWQWGSGVALDASPAPAAPRVWGGGANHIHHAQGQQGCGAPGHIVNYARSPGRRAGGSWTPKLVVDTRARPRHCRVRCGARRPQSMAEARRSAAQERPSTTEETLARVESPAMLRSQRAAACRRSRCYLVPRNLCRAACSTESESGPQTAVFSVDGPSVARGRGRRINSSPLPSRAVTAYKEKKHTYRKHSNAQVRVPSKKLRLGSSAAAALSAPKTA